MKKQIIGAVVAAALAGTGVLTACGSDDSADRDSTPRTTVSSAQEPVLAKPATPADIALAPGSAGPVKVGMSKTEAADTGLFDTDVASSTSGCPTEDLVWKRAFRDVLDVQTLDDGEVASIGVRGQGPTTEAGIGVGSTLADVLAAHPGAKAVEAGYGQTGVLVKDAAGDGWIGYLFDAEVEKVEKTDTVTFIELTASEKPSVMRDGC
jgi:hypothetical protein